MKKHNTIALLGIVVLLVLGYTIPIVSMAVEDDGLLKESKCVKLDNIELSAQSMELEELMQVFHEVLLNNIVVESSNSMEQLSSTEAYENIKLSVHTFMNLFAIGDVEFVDIKVEKYVMMVNHYDERVCSVWRYYGIDKMKQEYSF